MSGILSLVRELILIAHPERSTQGWFIFWRCAVIAFVMSSAMLWFFEHNRVLELEERLDVLTKPEFKGSFGFAVAPVGDRSQDSLITADGMITNTGAPSIAGDWAAQLRFKDGHTIDGQPVMAPTPESKITLHQDSGPPLVMLGSRNWKRTASNNPIPTGGGASGWIQFVFRGVNAAELDKGAGDGDIIVMLSFADVNGQRWPIIFAPSTSGPALFPQTLQKHTAKKSR